MEFKLRSFLFIVGSCLVCQKSFAQTDSSGYDPFLLTEVIISDLSVDQKLNSAVSAFSLNGQDLKSLSSVASQLENIPGVFADASLGEVFARIHTRGISLSAEDDIGWYYTGLLEDGLPISAVQMNHFSPDFFIRPDLSVHRLEMIKGGTSGIFSQNAPGGIVNYLTHPIQSSYSSHDKVTVGLHNNGESYFRIEGYSGGPIGTKNWFHGFSYLYRYDRGPRDTDYPLNKGGQIKASITKLLPNGLFSLKAKYLNDRVNRYTGLPATNWQDPEPLEGFDFARSSLLPPTIEGRVPDSRTDGQELLDYNPANGIKAKELSIQSNLNLALGEWMLDNKLKYSSKDLNWQSAIGGQPLFLDNFLSYFISGDPFPIGLVSFKDVQTQNVEAVVNNAGVLNAFQGLPPSFEYIQGALPNDAIMGTGSWLKQDEFNEWMNDLRLTLSSGDNHLVFGSFFSHSSVTAFTNASFVYTTYESEPRALEVILSNPGEPERSLSDALGLSNYGALFYEGGDISVSQFAVYGQGDFVLSESFSMDAGFRLERIGHSGFKNRFLPIQAEGGLDGNQLTSYDNSLLVPGEKDEFDFSYSYLSYSIGLNHQLSTNTTAYTRYSNSNKAPELNYYLNNFSNVPIPGKSEVQDIEQLEIGFKYLGIAKSLTVTGFYSRLSNVPFSEFVFDQDNNQVFYTPTQLNASETIGIELEWNHNLSGPWGYSIDLTLQRGVLKDYRLYQSNGTVDTSDDGLNDFSGNFLPHNPSHMANTELYYQQDGWKGALSWKWLGSRYANFENSFTMPGFHTFNLSLSKDLSKRLYAEITVTNLFNGSGLINFFGPNEFGSNANQASAEYIAQNPQGSFVVFPILPRSFYFSIGYRFSKGS